MKSLGWTLFQYDCVSIKRENLDREIDTCTEEGGCEHIQEDGHVTGVTHLQAKRSAKDCQQTRN